MLMVVLTPSNGEDAEDKSLPQGFLIVCQDCTHLNMLFYFCIIDVVGMGHCGSQWFSVQHLGFHALFQNIYHKKYYWYFLKLYQLLHMILKLSELLCDKCWCLVQAIFWLPHNHSVYKTKPITVKAAPNASYTELKLSQVGVYWQVMMTMMTWFVLFPVCIVIMVLVQ